MKTYPANKGDLVRMIFCLGLTGGFLLTGLAHADGDKSGKTPAKTCRKKDGKANKVMVTGSNIPEKADRVKGTPTTASPVVIIERDDIERSGRTTVAGVLKRHPATR